VYCYNCVHFSMLLCYSLIQLRETFKYCIITITKKKECIRNKIIVQRWANLKLVLITQESFFFASQFYVTELLFPKSHAPHSWSSSVRGMRPTRWETQAHLIYISVLLKANYSHCSVNFGCCAMVPYLPKHIINQKNEVETKLYVI
jgi:hypothetical protein